MKKNDSLAAVLLSFFDQLGHEWCEGIMQAYAEISCQDGPFQKALLLWCTAQPMPTCSKSQASGCATWFSALLHDVDWQLRMCGIYCLQRLMAGCMEPEPLIHEISVLLKDKDSFVRQSAALVIGT